MISLKKQTAQKFLYSPVSFVVICKYLLLYFFDHLNI